MAKRDILKRLEKKLRSLGYAEQNLCSFNCNGIGVLYRMNEGTEQAYCIRMRWFVDDEEDRRVFFIAKRESLENINEDEIDILRFCNHWNLQGVPGTAVYDKEDGLRLYHTMPLPDRVDDTFLSYQIYYLPAAMSNEFFKETEKFKWSEKGTEKCILKN